MSTGNTNNHAKPEQPESKPAAPQAQEPCPNTARALAGGEGFEPPTSGSGGLCPILARLPAHNTLSRHESEIINYGLWLRKEGYSIHTVTNDVKRLRRLDRRCSILEAEACKRLIANSNWNAGGKQHICEVLGRFYRFLGVKWNRPRYQQVESLPWIPHTDEVEALINALGNPLVGTFVHLIKDTGARSGEAWQLQWHHVDFESRIVTLTPEKGSLGRQVKVSQALISKLTKLRNERKFVFHSDSVDPIKALEYFTRNFQRGRSIVAKRLGNPRINLISFRTLRHYKGSMEYYRTRDIIHVKQVLGHKSINNTMRYVSLIPREDDDFIVQIGTDKAARVKLLEEGFELIGQDGNEWYLRKRK